MTAVQRKAAFMAWIAGHFFLRFHMALILGGTFLAGLAVTKMFLDAGNTNLAVRYGVAVAASYAAFLLLINLWLWYVGARSEDDEATAGDVVDALDLAHDLGSGLRPAGQVNAFDAGVGASAGAGRRAALARPRRTVSRGWSETPTTPPARSSWSCSWPRWCLPSVAGAYLVWAAPGILAEAAFEAFLASALIPGARRSEAQGWLHGTVRATVGPFTVMMIAAVGFGWAATNLCPAARRMADVVACARNSGPPTGP